VGATRAPAERGCIPLRGGYTDPYDQDGYEPPEPSLTTVVAWAGVAAVAFVMAMAALVFGLPSATPPGGDASTAAVADGSGGSTGIVARSDFTMQSTTEAPADGIAALRVENAALRQSVQTLTTTIAELSGRIAEIEQRFGSITGSVTPPTRPVSSPDRPDVAADVGENRDPATARRTAFGVELGVFPDLGSARIAWRSMVDASPGLFADLEPIASVRDRDGHLELLLVAGPFATADDAAGRCAQVTAEALTCLPAFFVGQPLSAR
jgi:hypothetical protein